MSQYVQIFVYLFSLTALAAFAVGLHGYGQNDNHDHYDQY